MGLVDWWYFTGVVTKALVIAGIAAMVVLALALIAPHVQSLRPIAQWLGLVEVVNRTVVQYQVINHTVVKYVNETVPVYVNRTVYVYVNKTTYVYIPTPALPEYYGVCSGRIVALPNGTGWLVLFMLVNPRQYGQAWLGSLGTLYANATTHYAQFGALLEPAVIVFPTANYTALSLISLVCLTTNYTINGYWPTVCGDTGGGPTTLMGMNASAFAESLGVNRTYEAVLLTSPVALSQGFWSPTKSMFIPCQLTITYAPNATAALWLPVTTNATLLQYWREGMVEVDGYYDPYDWTMGYWVWLTPS